MQKRTHKSVAATDRIQNGGLVIQNRKWWIGHIEYKMADSSYRWVNKCSFKVSNGGYFARLATVGAKLWFLTMEATVESDVALTVVICFHSIGLPANNRCMMIAIHAACEYKRSIDFKCYTTAMHSNASSTKYTTTKL